MEPQGDSRAEARKTATFPGDSSQTAVVSSNEASADTAAQGLRATRSAGGTHEIQEAGEESTRSKCSRESTMSMMTSPQLSKSSPQQSRGTPQELLPMPRRSGESVASCQQGSVDGEGHSGQPELSFLAVVQLSLWYLPYLVLFLLVFTEIGFGATAFKALMRAGHWANDIAFVGALMLLLLYCFDFSFWSKGPLRSTLVPLKYVGLAFWGTSVVISVCLTFRSRPYAPLLAYLVGMCTYFFLIFRTTYPKHNLTIFLRHLGFTIVLWGFAGLIASILWAGLTGFWWGPATRQEFQDRLRVCSNMTVAADGSSWCQRYGTMGVSCPKGCEEVPDQATCDPGSEGCLAAFLLWGAPFVLAVMKMLMGGCLQYIAAADTHGSGKPDLQNARIYLIFLAIFAGFIWVAASIASASPELSEMVSAMAVTGLAVMFALLGLVVGFRQAGEALMSEKFYGMVMSFRQSDWIKGMLVLIAAPVFVVFLLLSLLNQFVRKRILKKDMRHPLTGKLMTVDERNLVFTAKGIHLITELSHWDWTNVLVKAVLVGFAYFVFMVGVSHWVTLFMAWLNHLLQGTSVFAVSFAIFVIAQGLFAIPVVPGVPAYIASGVIIGNAGQNEGWSFEASMIWAIVVAQICKQAACLMQQKLFGERLGAAIWVRSALGVNTKVTKGIKLILLDPGVTLQKVFLLVGGPDWPTSVLTGVLRIPVIPCQLGTLPVVIPIAITVLAGGAMTKTGDFWENMAGILLMLSAITLGGSFVFFFIALERVFETRADEIDQMLKLPEEGGEFDEEIAKFEKEQAELEQVKLAVSSWEVLGSVWQSVLVLSLCCMIASSAIFAIAPDQCFETINATTDYFGPPIYGNAFNLLKPLGWWGMGLQVASLLLLVAFRRMQRVRSRNTHADLAATSTAAEAEAPPQAGPAQV